jgi:RsiW-degrading membrane proteinase PrsW (M82 family)
MIYLILIIFGLAPSVIWLLFYLRKDAHPESNRMILKIFFYGMLAAVIAALIEIGISGALIKFGEKWLKTFLIIALVEEFSKYLIVREKVINNPEFDEPVDTILYMIITALGFAALENILVLFSGKEPVLFGEAIALSSFRFIGATFLHALCSGTLGYFLALSFFEPKKRMRLIIKGIMVATLLHGLFNISIIGIEEGLTSQSSFLLFSSVISLVVILSGLALFVSFGFRKLKKLKSICKT